MAAKKKSQALDFESAIEELEQLVRAMEQGDLSLEQSLKNFERGIELTRSCHQALRDAEQKVQLLTREGAVDIKPEDLGQE